MEAWGGMGTEEPRRALQTALRNASEGKATGGYCWVAKSQLPSLVLRGGKELQIRENDGNIV